MAKKLDGLSNEQKEIVKAQNDARLRLPEKLEDRLKLIHGYRVLVAQEKDAVKEAKDEIGAAERLKLLTKNYGLLPQALKAINIFEGMTDPLKRAAAARQTIAHLEESGFVYRDLFDDGAVGVGSNDAPGETAGFDKTSEGRRRGGASAQPRTTEQMAASHEPPPSPAVPLDEARKQLEAYKAANPPKRGPKPNELKRLEAQVEAAKQGPADPDPANDDDPALAEKPAAEPGQVSQEIREGHAEADAHLKGQIAETTAEKPKATRTRKAKEKPPVAESAPPAPPADDEEQPPAPPAEDDEDEDGPMAAHPGRPGIGDQPASYGIR